MAFKEVMRCKYCDAPIHQVDAIGSNIARTMTYYACPKCGKVQRLEKKPAK